MVLPHAGTRQQQFEHARDRHAAPDEEASSPDAAGTTAHRKRGRGTGAARTRKGNAPRGRTEKIAYPYPKVTFQSWMRGSLNPGSAGFTDADMDMLLFCSPVANSPMCPLR